jgi:hypothetical protein
VGHDGAVRRSRAIEHLVEMAAESSEMLRLRGTDIGWPLEELWVTGDLLTDAASLDAGSVVLVLDVPADEVPWLALHPAGEWVGDRLRLGKRPMQWSYRPAAWPVWNHEHPRLVRFWSATGGLDDGVISALRDRRLAELTVVEPAPGELADWLRGELEVSRRHLRETLDHYWDQDWRREHKGFGERPEDHLWRAASAVADMTEALDALDG